MNLSARYLFSSLPFQNMTELPQSEHDAASKIRTSCIHLISFAEYFEAAVTLFQEIRAAPRSPMTIGANQWLFVPARDGAMTLYQIGFLFESIRASFKDCPTARKFTDHNKLRELSKRFREAFPLFEQLRHSVGHAAEILTNHSENALKETVAIPGFQIGAGNLLMNGLSGNVFTQTISGKAVSYELSESSVQIILEIVRETFSAIRSNSQPSA